MQNDESLDDLSPSPLGNESVSPPSGEAASPEIPEPPSEALPVGDVPVPEMPSDVAQLSASDASTELPTASGDVTASFDHVEEAPASEAGPVDAESAIPGVVSADPNTLSPSAPAAPPTRSFQIPFPMPQAKSPLDVFGKQGGPNTESPRGPESPRIPFPPAVSAGARGTGTESKGTVPRIMITVTLGHAPSLLDDAIQKELSSAVPSFRKIVLMEIEQAEWNRQCELRAADYRLRGPYLT